MNTAKTIAAIALSALISTSALAGSSIEDTHFFRLGAYKQKADIQLGSTIKPFKPITINLADDLGTDDSSTAGNALYRWHFTHKWSLSVAYQRLELEGRGIAEKSFNFEGKEFTVGVQINTDFDMDTYLVDIGYSFVHNDKWEVTFGLGIHAFDIDSSIAGQITVTDGTGASILEGARAAVDVLAPLPNLRGSVTYMINPKWEVNASLGWLSLKIDEVDGKYLYFDLGTEYRISDRFGIGASYQLGDIDVTVDKTARVDKFDLEFEGPSIYISYGF